MANDKTEVAPGVELSDKEIQKARTKGAKEALKDGGKAAVLADTGTTGDLDAVAETARLRVRPDLLSTVLEPLLRLPLDTLVQRMNNEKVDGYLDFETVKGLLDLERSGQNRTPYVQAMCKRLGVEDPRDVTSAGPSYTNDVTNITHLDER